MALTGAKHAAAAMGGLTAMGKKEAAKSDSMAVPSMLKGKFKDAEIEKFKK